MYPTVPNETDLDNLEYLISLNLTANALMLLMYHYVDLRLDCLDGTPGMNPEQALHHTMRWAQDVRLIAHPACIA